ncbi:MAG: capsular polysaccharide biosynthesis protein [Paracoccaceae bacterium]
MISLYPATVGLWQLRHMLATAGYQMRLGLPGVGDWVAVWGHGPYAWRGEALARRTGARLLRIEDAPLRSLLPGRATAGRLSGKRGWAAQSRPMGLLIDPQGCHYRAHPPSHLAGILATHPLSDPALLARADQLVARIQACHLSKYAACDPDLPLPPKGYVLVVDQVAGDASAPDPMVFVQMLAQARQDHPDAQIVIKAHPETQLGLRQGHLANRLSGHLSGHLSGPPPKTSDVVLSGAYAPWPLLHNARAVYTVSSQLGFEAILAGHRPHVFGTPIYAGWGLTQDAHPLPDRTRRLNVSQLAATLLIVAPHWVDPYTGMATSPEAIVEALAAQTRAWRADRHGWVITGAKRWKRRWMQDHFGRWQPPLHRAAPIAPPTHRPHMGWGHTTAASTTVEDGFIRSRGLGAHLVRPQSLCLDHHGVHYDPSRACDLEALIAASPALPPPALIRATALHQRLITKGHTKYGLTGELPDLPQPPQGGRRLLVLGQVANDASVALGAPGLNDRSALRRARAAAQSEDIVIYKPHPDVLAGLRPGLTDGGPEADITLPNVDLPALFQQVEAVWTLTSLGGFEALLQGCAVTCLGTPFYAGWGLTQDLGPACPRRRHGISLHGLIHAALIDYPRYWDPVTGLPCPVETLLDRLEALAPRRQAPQGVTGWIAQLWAAGKPRT